MTEEREGALRGWPRAQYLLHMTICVYCRRCRKQLEDAIQLSREVPPGEVPSSVEDPAVAAYRGRSRG